MRRILILGVSGAGKSTLGRELAQRTGLPYIATDPMFWEANWRPASSHDLCARIDAASSAERWILDGNFENFRNWLWRRADTIVWLDFSRALVLFRVIRRNLRWALTREVIWSGNTMSLRRAWSGIRHCFRSYRSKRANYARYLADFPQVNVLRFRSPKELAPWLESIPVSSGELQSN